ncbi:MAG: hypothetical protein HY978_02010 [Candidatus Liptonbacteria bacterium]|nr:hypothetical protein [Candidatus Liptonbacteria bacterium]
MENQFSEEQFKKLLNKVAELKKDNKLDLSTEEDLSLAIMNLVSLEEHYFFTAEKTGKPEYFDLLSEVREIRKTLLARMIPAKEGEAWCISKHLLAATMRLIEVGTKLYGSGQKEEGRATFDQAYRIYALFWGIRLKLIDLAGVKKIDDGQLNIHDTAGTDQPHKPWSYQDIVEKLVDCCDE